MCRLIVSRLQPRSANFGERKFSGRQILGSAILGTVNLGAVNFRERQILSERNWKRFKHRGLRQF